MKKQITKAPKSEKTVKIKASISKKILSESIGKYGIIIVAVVAFLLHFQTIFFDYTNCDDDLIISKNEYLSDFSNFTGAFSEPYFGGSYYRPMVIASFVVDANIAGEKAWVYHLFNVIYHIISCIGIVLLFRKLKYSDFLAMIAGLVYATHPIFTNSVSWILGRNDLLVGMFGIYAFIFLIIYVEKKKPLYLAIHFILLLLSTLSKEAGLILPVAGILYFWLIQKDKLINPRTITVAIAWIGVAIIWFSLKSNAVVATVEEGDFAYVNLLKNIRQLPELIARFIIPYNNLVLPTYNNITLIIGFVVVGALGILTYFRRERRLEYMLFGFLWFLLFVFPGLFISIKDKPDYFDYLDTRMYLPMIGMLVLLFELIPNSYKSFDNVKKLIPYVSIIAVLAIITFFHSKNYDNRYDFWSCAIKNDPGRARFYNQLGVYYLNENNHEKASEYFLKAIELNPNEVSYYSKLGLNYFKQKEAEKAIRIYSKGREINRYDSELNINFAAAYNDLKLYDSAIVVLNDALLSNKNMISVLTNLINAHIGKEQFDSAMKYASIQSQMGNRTGIADTYMQWGVKLYGKGDLKGAHDKMQKANEALPNSDRVLNSLAAVQMISGLYKEAEANLLRANQLNPNAMEVYNNLIKLYAYYLIDKSKVEYYAREMKRRGGNIDPDALKQMLAQ